MLTPVKTALELIAANRPFLKPQDLPLSECSGMRLAEDVIANLTQPPFAASAMDGYAVKFSDAAIQDNTLVVIGDAPAGSPFPGAINQGQAVRLFTGSVIPDGADHVIIQENVTREGDQIKVNHPSDKPGNIRKAGIDFAKGDILIKSGTILSPAHIALAAAGNHAELFVTRRPVIAFIANGDELKPPGSKLATGQIISSNQSGLAALAESWGADTIDMGIAADDLDSIKSVINSAIAADIIVPIGGASVGDHDHMRAAFKECGFETVFEKIGVKPGKPTWLATKDGQTVLGLPGNPASANVCAHLFLKTLTGLQDSPPFIRGKLTGPIGKNWDRETYARGRLHAKDGELLITPFPKQDSSLLSPLADANVLIRLTIDTGPWAKGDMIEVTPLAPGLETLG